MTKADLLGFARRHRVAVQTSVAKDGAPQAAVVGIAVGDDFEIVFDTLQTTRKAQNLGRDPRIALVLGGWALVKSRGFSTRELQTSRLGLSLSGSESCTSACIPMVGSAYRGLG